METLLARDSEGMYRKALAHELTNVAGIDDPFEPPTRAELVVRTDQEKPDAALGRLFQKLVDMKYVNPAEFALLTGGLRPKRPGARGAKGAPVAAKAAPGPVKGAVKPAKKDANKPASKSSAKPSAKPPAKAPAKAKRAAKGRRG
jgi:hypothetical protein